MTECMSLGSEAKLIIEDGALPRTFDVNSERWDFLYETLTKKRRRIGNRTIKGDLSDWKERNVEGASMVTGVIAFQASPLLLSKWIPRIIGTITNGDNPDGDPIYEPGTSLPSFDVLIHRAAKVFRYSECYVNQCEIRGESSPGEEEPEIVDVVVQLVGKTMSNATAWPDPEPEPDVSVNSLPDVIGLSTLNVGAESRDFDRFILTIDNNLQVRWRNSLTPTCIRPGMRKVRLQTNNPFITDTYDELHETLDAPVSGILRLVRGDAYTEFEFGTLDNMGEDPNARGKTEMPHVLDFQALRDYTNSIPEITGTTHLDS